MLIFKKAVGYHREAPRLYFQTLDLNEYGFVPGARYDAEAYSDGRITLKLHPEGRRAVCKKTVNGRVLSIIDLNGKSLMEGLRGADKVEVGVKVGEIIIMPETT